MNAKTTFDVWTKKLPPELFEFHGFGLLWAVDVTDGQIVSTLKNDLLQKDALGTPEKIDLIQSRLQSLAQAPDLMLGLISIDQGEFNKTASIRPLGRSLLLSRGVAPSCTLWQNSVYAKVCDGRTEPIQIQDLVNLEEKTGFEEYLVEQGYKNLLLVPLFRKKSSLGY